MQLYIVTTQTFEPFSVYYLNGYNQSTCGCRRLRPERKKQGPILCWCLKAGCSAVLVPRQRGVGTPLFQMSAASVVFLFCCHDKNILTERDIRGGVFDLQFQVTVHYFGENKAGTQDASQITSTLKSKWKNKCIPAYCPYSSRVQSPCLVPVHNGLGLYFQVNYQSRQSPQKWPQTNLISKLRLYSQLILDFNKFTLTTNHHKQTFLIGKEQK